MPYIPPAKRGEIGLTLDAESAGELNYQITMLVDSYLAKNKTTYAAINEAIGVLECAKLELYRRIAVPYEESKMAVNGDVYSFENVTEPSHPQNGGGETGELRQYSEGSQS